MVKKIVDINHKALREKSKRVVHVDKKIKALISDMKDTLKAQLDPEGIGLAAPQIGKNVQVFVINYEGLQRVVINPKVIKIGKLITPTKITDETLEGCLSVPHYYGPVPRAESITISYMTEDGTQKEESFKGFPAHIVQHEIDHLNGVIFVDHIISNDAPLYQFVDNEWHEVELH